MTDKKPIETQVKNTVLEKPQTIQVGSKTYEVAPPTIATLILASEAVSRLPKFTLDPDKLVQECFSVAKDCRVLGEIAAVLILGAQRSERKKKTPLVKGKRLLWGLLSRRRKEKDILTDEVLLNLSPKALFNIISQILATMQLSDFFGLTTFLSEINLLHQTKVEN